MTTTPTSRLLQLLSLLQTRRDWPGRHLADRMGVSPRTVRRDVDRLRGLGYRVTAVMGPDGGYRLEAGAELPPLLFDDEQAVALALALRTASAGGVATDVAAARALATVRQLMPAALRHRVDAVTVTAVGRHPAVPAVDPEVLVAVSAAAHRREVLRFDYGVDADRPARRAEPHHVVSSAGRWYLVAWDLDREDWRTFRLDRLRPRMRTGVPFRPRALPGGEVAAFLTGTFRGSVGTGDWPCRGEATLARPAHEVAPFLGDGTVVAVGADHCRVSVGSWSWPALAASLGRLDTAIDEVSPAELREACTLLAARYGQAGQGTVDRTPPAGR
ncbi:helix-turn-helix transcriptional regulator [Georgenia satyanarayanai]|uniref:helix-turn-helix transcriptional regulator n=1 Tax=Georgenia satyanarayanai TaxID=860221 RepID=UPI0012656CF4|nr:WYL domain-containing protein [Georgenia satyanarayanai]